jgi:hypothetical protein
MMDSSVSLLLPTAGMAAADSPIHADGAFVGWMPSSVIISKDGQVAD